MDGELALLITRAHDEKRPLRLSAARLRALVTSDVRTLGRVWERGRTRERCPHGAPTSAEIDGHGCRVCIAAEHPVMAGALRDSALYDLDCLCRCVEGLAREASQLAEDAAGIARGVEIAAMDLRQRTAELRALCASPPAPVWPALAPGVAVTTVAAGVATTVSAETEAPDGE